MTYKAYLDNIYAKTGEAPEDYQAKRLVGYGDLLKWLKTECGLGHGHANAIILYIQDTASAKSKVREEAKAEGVAK